MDKDCEISNIDTEEFSNQYYDSILKKGEYCEVKLIIESGKDNCLPQIRIKKASLRDVAFMIASLENVKKTLAKQFPEANLLSLFADLSSQELK